MTAVFFDQVGRERTLLELGLTPEEAPIGDMIPIDVYGSSLEPETKEALKVEDGAHFHEGHADADPMHLVKGVGMVGVHLAKKAA